MQTKTKIFFKRKTIIFLVICLLIVFSAQDSCFAKTTRGAWELVGPHGFAGHAIGLAQYHSFAFNPVTNEPYVAYYGVGDDGDKPNVKKFNGSSWENVGVLSSCDTLGGDHQAIAFHPGTGEPYITCGGNSGTSVKKFNGTSWENVGTVESIGEIAFNPSTNEPYVATGSRGKVSVKKFNGTSWEYVGSPDFLTAGYNEDTFIVFNPLTHEPYVYYDGTVMKFDGSSWVNVGSDNNLGDTYYAIAFNPSTGEPYVVFRTDNNTHQIQVKKFNGASWEFVGPSAGFGNTTFQFPSIAFDPSTNKPYVAINDLDKYYGRTSVFKFNGKKWEVVGSRGFASEGKNGTWHNLIAFNPSTNEPYVAYWPHSEGSGISVMKYTYVPAVINSSTDALTDTPTLDYSGSKLAKNNINLTIGNFSASTKKQSVKIRIGKKKAKTISVRKSGSDLLITINLNYGKLSRGQYGMVMTYKGKVGKYNQRGTLRDSSILTIN